MSHRFNWSTNINTGIEELDAQHHRLLHLINLLDQRPAEEAVLIVEEFQRFLTCHFACEEALMAAYRSDELEVQRKEHADEGREVDEMAAGLAEGHLTKTELCERAYQWLITHTIDSDMAMAGPIMRRRQSFDA